MTNYYSYPGRGSFDLIIDRHFCCALWGQHRVECLSTVGGKGVLCSFALASVCFGCAWSAGVGRFVSPMTTRGLCRVVRQAQARERVRIYSFYPYSGCKSTRFVGGRSQAGFQFGPDYFKQRSVTNVNGVRWLFREGEMGNRDRFRFATIRALLWFLRTASAACGIGPFIKAGVLSSRCFVRCRIKEGDRIRCSSEVVIVMYTQFYYRTMPFAIRVRERVIGDLQSVSLDSFLFCRGVLTSDNRRLFQERPIRIFCGAIMVGGDRLINQRACDRGMVMLLVSLVIYVLLHFFNTCRNYNDQTVVAVNGVGDQRNFRDFYSDFCVFFFISRPR